jgi:glycosyltransferase involved in cell wall biosynthesis
MAMGKAVVITRTQGQKDVVRDGVDGLYVPPGDASALRAAILSLVENPDRCLRMGQKARQALEAGMTLDHWVQRVSKVVVDAVAARAA